MLLKRLLRLLAAVLSVYAIGAYVWLALQRCVYPVEVDFIEGVMLDHVVRAANGLPIYVEPSLHYIPLAYMPLFTAVSGLVMRLGVEGFLAMRSVSLVSSILLMAVMAFIVVRETGRPVFALSAAGIYAISFGLTGACYDVGRPDSLMLLLTFAGLATLRFTRGTAGAIAAAAVLTLGFFTKQHSLLFSFGALAYLFFHQRQRLVPFAAAIVTGCAGGYALLMLLLGPWFRVFTWSIPAGWSQFNAQRVEHYLGRGLFGALSCSTVPTLLSLAAPESEGTSGRLLWYWTGLAAVGTGLLATLDKSAYLHVFTPTVVALGVLGPLALDRLLRHFESQRPVRAFSGAMTVAILAGQFVPLIYGLPAHRPRPHAAEAHQALVERLKTFPHGAIVPYHSWYGREAGGKGSLQFIALDDIERSRNNDILRRDPKFLERMFAPLASGPNRPAIVTDVPLYHTGPLWRGIEHGYQLADSFPSEFSEALRPLTGNQHTITYLYLPIEPPPAAVAAP